MVWYSGATTLFGIWIEYISVCVALAAWFLPADASSHDVRTWHHPTDPDIAISFSTPEIYCACPNTDAADTITVSGLEDGWRLLGEVRLTFLDGERRVEVPDGTYVVDFTSLEPESSYSLAIEYPPANEWVKNSDFANHSHLHVDIAIVVSDEHGEVVEWVGGDLLNAPGTLGPGGQDWTVICAMKSPPMFLPLISHE